MATHRVNRPSTETVLREAISTSLENVEQTADLDVLAIFGPLVSDVDDRVRQAVEQIDNRRNGLLVILDTGGGLLDVAERIVTVIRRFYPRNAQFLIPDRAMSAGTLLAMSGNRVLMDYFSVLGPIDPQVERVEPDGNRRLVPALAYLDQVEAIRTRAAQGTMTTADVTLLNKLDLAELRTFELAAEMAIDLVKKWLVKYKFEDWVKTESRGQPVTDQMKEDRADQIAKDLNDHKRWCTHGRGISRETLSQELRLKIDDLDADQDLKAAVMDYFWLVKAPDPKSFVHSRGFI